MSARTIGLAAAGEGDAAASSAISAIKARRALRPGQRSTCATHDVPVMLSLSKPSEDALSRLQEVLAEEENADGATRDFVAARAQLLDMLWCEIYGVGPGRLLPRPFPWELFPSPWMRPLDTHRIVDALRAWSELSDIAHRPWPERARLAEAAITRYRRAHADNLPVSRSDLVPRYLTEIPEDPLTGKPLIYAPLATRTSFTALGPMERTTGGSDTKGRPDIHGSRDDIPAER